MSRVGKKIITIPNGVQFSIKDNVAKAKGPKGELSFAIPSGISFTQEGNTLTFSRSDDHKKTRALHGMTRAQVANILEGVSNGFQKNLGMEGVGYKVEMKGKRLLLSVGFSHPILFIPPDGIEFAVLTPTTFSVKGIDKQLVGEIAAKIRFLRPPEPYKGKGIRYEGEYIRRKAGKAAGK
ncbi:MAG: 50S ribosomal protein L6 [Candidatus Kapabacteria bacterium]|nr:50S ribosomal protein L6 [Candidatus Kapabacteria bacterium]MBX7153791.1 50S ribosomal protein L6 [Bacteroidota bacterium]